MFEIDKAISAWRWRMSSSGVSSPEVLDELESHLRDEVDQQLRSGSNLEQSFQNAMEKIGSATAIREEFNKVGITKNNPMMNHNRVYTATLWVFAVYNVIIIFCGLFYWRAVGGQLTEPMGRYPGWALRWMFALTCVYTVLIIWTLIARRFQPQLGRRLSRILNWALLPAIPGGTVIGIYGLLAADRGKEQNV